MGIGFGKVAFVGGLACFFVCVWHICLLATLLSWALSETFLGFVSFLALHACIHACGEFHFVAP